MPRPLFCLLLLALLAALGGCGLKGPLYMPSTHAKDKQQHSHVPAARSPAATSSAPALPADDDSAGTGGPY